MIIAGCAEEIDNVINGLAIAGCEVCPAKEKCKDMSSKKEDNGLSCKEMIKQSIRILNIEPEERKGEIKWQPWEHFLLERFLDVR